MKSLSTESYEMDWAVILWNHWRNMIVASRVCSIVWLTTTKCQPISWSKKVYGSLQAPCPIFCWDPYGGWKIFAKGGQICYSSDTLTFIFSFDSLLVLYDSTVIYLPIFLTYFLLILFTTRRVIWFMFELRVPTSLERLLYIRC